jgi:hypothetical protein
LWKLKLSGDGWLRRLDKAELLARGNEVVLDEDSVDIFDRARLIMRASRLCRGEATTAVFFAPDGHCTFVHRPDVNVLREIQVLDITPENLATLHRTVKHLDDAGVFGDLELTFNYVSFDVTAFAGEGTVFPCESSGIEGLYLNRGEVRDVKRLVGCNISQSILDSLGGSAEEFVDFCPHTSPHLLPSAPFLARCCRSERLGPLNRNGQQGIVVHWGVSVLEVIQAVRELKGLLEDDGCSK